jgi:hypothetical protein
MSKPESRGPGRAPLPKARVDAFFHPLGRTGSVTVAANRAQLRRSALYKRRQNDDAFAERWARALDLGVERLQDNAMNRAPNGTPRPVWRNGQKAAPSSSSTIACCSSCRRRTGPISTATAVMPPRRRCPSTW